MLAAVSSISSEDKTRGRILCKRMLALNLTKDEVKLLAGMGIATSHADDLTISQLHQITDILPQEYFRFPNDEPTAKCLVAEELYDKSLDALDGRVLKA